METCKICGEEFKNLKSIATHIKYNHHLCSKEYYDKYMKKDGEGQCTVCGKETTYRNTGIGYLKTCSIKCRSVHKEYSKKLSESKVGKKQSVEHINNRIKNTDQVKKEHNRKKTMMDKYGVNNPTKLNIVKKIISKKNKGIKKPKTDEWQNKIIKSKKNNGTLKHSEETKRKISRGLNQHYLKNLDREKYLSQANNVKHLSGWYNGLYFRSSLELSFLLNNQDKNFLSCENNKYKILYYDNDNLRVYYPDFTDGDIIYEIKPTKLLNTYINKLKIQEGIKTYGDKYKLITEVESPYVEKHLICDLINSGEVKLTVRSEKVLEKYRF